MFKITGCKAFTGLPQGPQLAHQIGAEQPGKKRDQQDFECGHTAGPALRRSQQHLQAADRDTNLHFAMTDPAGQHRLRLLEDAVARLIHGFFLMERTRQNLRVTALCQHGAVGVKNAHIFNLPGARGLGHQTVQRCQVLRNHGVFRSHHQQSGPELYTTHQLGFVRVAQDRQGATHQHRQQHDFDQGNADDGFGAKAHGGPLYREALQLIACRNAPAN